MTCVGRRPDIGVRERFAARGTNTGPASLSSLKLTSRLRQIPVELVPTGCLIEAIFCSRLAVGKRCGLAGMHIPVCYRGGVAIP